MIKRKNYFVKKKFQSSFFLKFILLIVLEAVLLSALFMHVQGGTLVTVYEGNELSIYKTNAYFFISFLLITLIVAFAVGITGIIAFILLTHRVGGPLYRFEKSIKSAYGGDVSQRLSLRKTDLLYDIKDELNSLFQEMDVRLSTAKNDMLNLVSEIENKNNPDYKKIKKDLLEIKKQLDYFRTSK